MKGDFALHERLRFRHELERRLLRASVVAAAVSLVMWLLGSQALLHAALTFIAAGATAAVPVRGASSWSLSYIRAGTGLAYETALEIDSRPRDQYGLRAAVRSRARTGVARLDPPQYRMWWIAGFVLALALLFLPAPAGLRPGPAPAGQPPASPETPFVADEEPGADAEEESPVAQPEVPAVPPGQQGPLAEERAADAPQRSETEVLDRFLENLRLREESPAQQSELAAAETTPAEPTAQEETDPGDETAESASDEQAEGDAGADAEDGTAPAEGQPEPGAGAEEGPEEGEMQAGADTEETAQMPAGEGEPGEVPAADQAGPDTGIDGDSGAGAEAGLPGDPSDQRNPAGGEEEFIEGQSVTDELNFGGDIRLPGFTDVEIPPGTSPASLGRAVERAVTEGAVPLDYQEVIRNYFR